MQFMSSAFKTDFLPPGATGIELFSVKGEKLWVGVLTAGKDFVLPKSLSRSAIYYGKFTK